MKNINVLLKLLSCLVISFSISAQEFTVAVNNPFEIEIDTSGGLAVFSFDFVDIDQDGDQDLIFPYTSDTLYKLAYQENIGSIGNPVFAGIMPLNAQFDVEPGLFIPDFKDLNGDGSFDILSFGSLANGNGLSCTYFQNNGDNTFETVNGNEIGLPDIAYSFGFPEIIDLNKDGDYDVILSGAELEQFTDEPDAFFYYGQNSNASDPQYVGWFTNPYDFSFPDTFQVSLVRSGDLDLDGDNDLMMLVSVTDDESVYMFQENIAPPGERTDFSGVPVFTPFGLPDEAIGFHQLADLDGDGDLDMFVLDELEILYFENTACLATTSEINASVCAGEEFLLNGETYSEEGSYEQVRQNAAGCDSTIFINLEILPELSSSFEEQICPGEPYNWEGELIFEAGEFERTFTSDEGCDSLVTLTLVLLEEPSTSFEASFCSGGAYIWNDEIYDEAGTYVRTLQTVLGCDSTVTLVLVELDQISTSFEDGFCQGSLYEWNGIEYSEAGMYEQTITTADGCDSVVTLNLLQVDILTSSFDDTFCDGEPYEWNGISYENAGSYEQTFASAGGCDSVVTLNLSLEELEFDIVETDTSLMVEVDGEVEVFWINCLTGELIPGQTDIEFFPSESGSYGTKLIKNGCEFLSACSTVTISNTEDLSLRKISIFPNPAQNVLTISYEGKANQPLEFTSIYNSQGQRFKRAVHANQVDVSDLEAGYYLLELQNGRNRWVRIPFVIIR